MSTEPSRGPSRAVRRRAAVLRRSGRRGAAAVTGTVVAVGALVVAADLALVAVRGTGPLDRVGGLTPVEPAGAARALADRTSSGVVTIAVGAGLALVGLLLVGLAVLPGGRRRRVIAPAADDLSAVHGVPVVADRGVLVDALASAAARAARTPDDQVDVRLRRRRADVEVTPLNGADVPVADVRAAADPLVERWGLRAGRRPVTVRVAVAEHGAVSS